MCNSKRRKVTDVATYKFKTYIFAKDITNKFKIKTKILDKHLPPAKKIVIFIKLII